jgi:hypothetical protein
MSSMPKPRARAVAATLLAAAASALVATSTPADERADTTRFQYLLDNKLCSNRTTCRNPPGKQVDHIIPLWAGGADHPSNMQLLSDEAHQLKTSAERQLQLAMLAAVRAGQAPEFRAPTEGYWRGGKWAGTMVRAYDDGRVLLRLDISKQFGEAESGRVAVLIAVPLAGTSQVPTEMQKSLQKSLRQHVGQQLLVAPVSGPGLTLAPARLAQAAFGGDSNFPPAIIHLRSAGADYRSINHKIIAEGLSTVPPGAVATLDKKVAKALLAAQAAARREGRNVWAAEAAANAARLEGEREARKRKKESSSNAGWRGDDDSEESSGGGQGQGSGRVQVRGYSRSDGTYVAPHTRSAPSGHGGSSGSFGFGGGRRR